MAASADAHALASLSRAFSHLPEPGWRPSQSVPLEVWAGLSMAEESLWDRCALFFSKSLLLPSRRSRVVAIHINNTGVQGALPRELAGGRGKHRHALNQLRDLILRNNAIHGTIPSSIGKLRNCRTINLAGNRLKGPLPAAIRQLQRLTLFDVHSNALSGCLSEQCAAMRLHRLRSLKFLIIGENDFTGPFPCEVLKCSWLIELHLSGLRLDGALPSFSNMESIQVLDLSSNQFTGIIPPFSPVHCPMIRDLRLHRNRLSGSLPPGISHLRYITRLDFSRNLLSGDMGVIAWGRQNNSESGATGGMGQHAFDEVCGDYPCHHGCMGNLTTLTSLSLAHNKIRGTLSPGLADLANLTFCDVRSTKIACNSSTMTILSQIALLCVGRAMRIILLFVSSHDNLQCS
jgi:Leucine-rich repeat (LRR) protein